jgi:hypothetical protein
MNRRIKSPAINNNAQKESVRGLIPYPVIAVTPTELRNLDYCLLDEARKMRKSGICRKFRLKHP